MKDMNKDNFTPTDVKPTEALENSRDLPQTTEELKKVMKGEILDI